MKTTAFKNTDIGPIPEDWEVKSLGDCGNWYGGGTPSTGVKAFWNGGVNWFTPSEVTGQKYLRTSERTISETGVQNSAARILPTGSILLTTRASIGMCAILNQPASTNQGLQSLVANSETDKEFIYYKLLTLTEEMVCRATGSTFLEISSGKLKEITLSIPPSLPEQRRIAAALSDADELVASLDKLIEKKKCVKEGAMQRLLSGETRLPGFTGKWVEKPVSDSLQSVGALNAPVKWRELQTPEEGSFPAFSASGQDVWTRNPIFHEDGIVVSAIGSRCGKAFLARGDWGVVANTHVILARNGACIPFWFYILNNEEWWIKAGTGQPYVLIRASLARTMTTPEPDEQRAIAAVLSDMDEEIAALARERAEAERIKQGMMQELLTGKTRLKGE